MPRNLDREAVQAHDLRQWVGAYVSIRMGRPVESNTVEELGPSNRVVEYGET